MGGKKRKTKIGTSKNQRLDLFLKNLAIEEDKREKILNYVENLTFETLQGKTKPELRLQKPNQD